VLALRAGPDRNTLAGKRVVVFGVGAIGSHAALTVAKAGTGTMTLVDADVLRPGDVVRHAAGTCLYRTQQG
jgi:tRNA A37 threonylcarbamoyladenosine dehydratase